VTPAGGSCRDAVVIVLASPDVVHNISPDPLDTFHASSTCSLSSLPLELYNLSLVAGHNMLEGNEIDCMESLGTFRGYDPSLDPYNLYLENMPVKILFTIAFNHSKDFSKAWHTFKRALIISQFMFKCFYLHPSELRAQVFVKLLRDLMAS